MEKRIQTILKKLSLQGRVEILESLAEGPMTPSELGKINNMPLSTVSRCLKVLSDCCLVKKTGNKYELTGIGYLAADYFSNVEQILSLWEYICDAGEFVKILPMELKPGLAYLCSAKIEPDPYAAVLRAMEDIKKAKNYGKYIDRIVSYEIFWIMAEKNLKKGVNDYVISPPSVANRKLEVCIQVFRDMNLTTEDLERIKGSTQIKLLDLPFQLGIIDGKVLYLQIFQGKKTETPFFISRDRKCVEWGERLFDYFWELAEPLDVVAEFNKYL
ncbi:MAG: hypothetical protein DRO98_06565 [Archaeoglobales archaeon]|nr:MAG: hypothetical protein DRO98_06565 [Archaeoglobales archaeon]